MTADFVARPKNSRNQIGTSLRNPAQNKKSSSNAMQFKQLQQPTGIFLNPHRVFVPIGWRYHVCEGLDMKIILDIDCKRVNQF